MGGRKNGHLREFAKQGPENRQFIIDNLRNMYKKHEIHDDLKEIFGSESGILLRGD